jgi:hypothetical protein
LECSYLIISQKALILLYQRVIIAANFQPSQLAESNPLGGGAVEIRSPGGNPVTLNLPPERGTVGPLVYTFCLWALGTKCWG